ncbi:MAG: ester cyclase [Pseudomonadota bacterium]
MDTVDSASDRVRTFWRVVWDEGRTEAIPDFMSEGFVIHSAGRDIGPRDAFRDWVASFQATIEDMRFEVLDLFEAPAPEGETRVATRWRITGRNRCFMGTHTKGRQIDLTGITISRVDVQGRIVEKWVERSAFEQHAALTSS